MTAEKTRWSKVDFPPDADPGSAKTLKIYLNGIEQVRDEDYEIDAEAGVIYFFKPIRKEKKLPWWRWLSIFIGVAGSYKQNDSGDVVCRAGGQLKHHVNLPIEVLKTPTEEQRGMLHGAYSPGG